MHRPCCQCFGILVVAVLLVGVGTADDPKPPTLTPEEEKLEQQAGTLNGEAVRAYRMGRLSEAVAKLRQSAEIFHKLYPEAKYPDGHPSLASSLNNLGDVLDAMGKPEDAVTYYKQALAVNRRLFPASKYPDGHPKFALNLNQVGFVLQKMGQAEPALTYFLQSLEMNRKLYPAAKYPDGHFYLANSVNNVGYVLQLMGELERALTYSEEGLEMKRRLYPASKFPNGHDQLVLSLNNMVAVCESMGQMQQVLKYSQQSLEMTRQLYPPSQYPDGHPLLVQCLTNQGSVLRGMGQAEQAQAYYRQSLDMTQKLYPVAEFPDGHPDVALSLHNLSAGLREMGQAEQALEYSKQSLAMKRKLYPAAEFPDGHPDLALGYSNLGAVLNEMGQAEQALPFYQQGLDMYRKLYPVAKYPDGHVDIALTLNNQGLLLAALGRGEKALSSYEESLGMFRKLFPAAKYTDGHPYIALNLNNLGALLDELGRAEQALTHHQQGLEMSQKLHPATKYPDGHPQLTKTLLNVSGMLEGMGQAKQALTYAQQSLEMHQRLMRRELATASEEAAFDVVKDQPLYLDAYLSFSRSAKVPADGSFAVIWPSRSMVTRLLEQRQANSRAAGTELGAKLDKLRGYRHRIDQLLQDQGMKAETRDKLLAETTEKRDKVERELIAAIPTLKRWQDLDRLGPAALVEALPAGAVFIDVIRYSHLEHVDKKQQRTARYVAFVLAKPAAADSPGNPTITRIDFDEPASAIDKALGEWRNAIEKRAVSSSAQWLREHLWSKLARALPQGTKTIYLAPDGDLARLPWAALPIAADRVLLEDFALAQVPHGLFLLDQLKSGKKHDGPESVLALGGVEYGPSKWPALPGTVAEIDALVKIAPAPPKQLIKADASVGKLKDQMPTVRYVHLATHGLFNTDALTAERKRAEEALKSRLLGDESRNVAAKNPLGYVGLVLANGELLSGLAIVDLPLQQTHLVTLSACETGLGEYTGGEGVQGLQRAFHLAGCPNVVASLWKVNDAATAALMTKFYHEMWVNKKPPIEALREAQLTIYRRPDLIQTLALDRGLKLQSALDAANAPVTVEKNSTTPTKLWAAFVLSGVGK